MILALNHKESQNDSPYLMPMIKMLNGKARSKLAVVQLGIKAALGQ